MRILFRIFFVLPVNDFHSHPFLEAFFYVLFMFKCNNYQFDLLERQQNIHFIHPEINCSHEKRLIKREKKTPVDLLSLNLLQKWHWERVFLFAIGSKIERNFFKKSFIVLFTAKKKFKELLSMKRLEWR